MDYKYEFERLLFTTKQALSAIDLKKKKILSLAELVILHNAVEYYNHRNITSAMHSDGEGDAVYCGGCGFT